MGPRSSSTAPRTAVLCCAVLAQRVCMSLHWAAASRTMQRAFCTQRSCFECMFQTGPACRTQPSQHCAWFLVALNALLVALMSRFTCMACVWEFHASCCSAPWEATSAAQPFHHCLTSWRCGSDRFLFHHGMCAKGCQPCLVGVVVGRQSAVRTCVVRRFR